MSDKIAVCSGHQERLTPMVYTFAFNGTEYWCPYCGKKEGYMETDSVTATPELVARGKADRTPEMRDFLFAVGYKVAAQIKYKGRWIAPSEIPKKEIARLEKVRAEWKYPISNPNPEAA